MTNIISEGEHEAESFASGGQLEKCYLLILPATSPAGGAAAAAMVAASIAGIGVEDATAGSKAGSTLQSSESTISGAAGNRVSFMFNPLSYTVEKSSNWVGFPEPSAQNAAVPTFTGSQGRTMSVEVLLDATYTQGNVQSDVDLLFSTCKPTLVSTLLKKPSPPFVIFGWGSNLGFLAYMQSVRAEYTLFKPDGTPLRANCSLTMGEIPINLPKQNPTSGGTAQRTRTVVAGDTLQSIAYREYGRPTLWRGIAQANGIDDPTRVSAGTTLLIPPLADAAEVG